MFFHSWSICTSRGFLQALASSGNKDPLEVQMDHSRKKHFTARKNDFTLETLLPWRKVTFLHLFPCWKKCSLFFFSLYELIFHLSVDKHQARGQSWFCTMQMEANPTSLFGNARVLHCKKPLGKHHQQKRLLCSASGYVNFFSFSSVNTFAIVLSLKVKAYITWMSSPWDTS